MTTDWTAPASEARIQRAAEALRANNIEAVVVDSGEDAKRETIARSPDGAEVHNGASLTLQATGITAALEAATNFTWLRKELMTMDRATQARAMRRLVAAPDVWLGSVQAITEAGPLRPRSAPGARPGP